MKMKKHLKWTCWTLIVAMVNMSASPAWANAPASPESGGPGGTGPGSNPNGSGGDPVDTKTGSNFFTEADFKFNTPGVPLEFSRTYNSIDTYESPMGPGWSHSMDWRLHESREIICKIVPSVTNANFKVNLWEGTQLLADGQSFTNSALQTNLLTVIPSFLFGAPLKEPYQAFVKQPGGEYYIDLDGASVSGSIGGSNPDPIASMEDMSGTALVTNGITYTENKWLELYQGDGNTTRFWDNDGDGTWWASDKNWRIVESGSDLVLHLPGGIQRVFNTDGRMTRYQDGWGKGIDFTYTSDLLQRAEHDNGQAIQFSYNGTLVSGIDAGATLDMAYTYTNGMLKTVSRDLGTEQHQYSYEYTDGILVKKTNPAGHEYNFNYVADANGKLTHKANEGYVDAERWLDQSLVYRSETLTDFTYHTRGIDQLYRYAYSSKTGNITDRFGPGIGNSDAESRGVRYGYNNADDETEVTLFDDNVSETFSIYKDYDNRHNPVTNSMAYNSASRTVLNSMNWNKTWMLPSSILDAEGNKTELGYQNGKLKMLKQFYASSNSYNTAFNYTTDGLRSSVINANGHVMQYTYDANGYPDLTTPAVGPVLDVGYDSYGNLHTLELLPEGGGAGTGRTTEFNYNALGWLESQIAADGKGVTNRYNGLGNLTNTVDRAGRTTDFTYAPTLNNKITSITRYLEQGGSNAPVRVSYDYDEWFNTVDITEPRGRYVESYQLDVQDRVTSVTNIEEQAMSIDYGVSDFVRKVTRFDGSSITNSHDGAGRMETVLYHSAADQLLETVAYDYYADGQVKSIADNTTAVTNAYDSLNRLVAVTSSVPSVSSVVNYQYDSVGNVTNSAINVGGSQASATTYSYDAAERLQEISTTDAGVFESVYNPTNGRISSISNTLSGITTSYAYDLLDRATNITYLASNGSAIRSLNYAYDVAGMITNKTINGGVTSVSSAYEYDSIYRLVGETRTGGTTSVLSYSYDLAGNRTSVIDNGATNAYTLGTGNRLASWGANGSALYDVAGNTTNLVSNDGTDLDLSWDERYRLVNVDEASSSIAYGYDVMGRKVSRTAGGSPASTEYYIYAGNQIVADVDASGSLLRSYSYGSGIDNILSVTVYGTSATNTYYYLKDHQNTVIALTDVSGSVVESYDYDAYGRILDVKDGSGISIGSQQSTIGNRYTFQGREIDWDTGLMYFRARWYNSETGHWLSKDPIGIAGGLNLYIFVDNNPVNLIDPMGLTGEGTLAPDIGTTVAGFGLAAWRGAVVGVTMGGSWGAVAGAAWGLAVALIAYKLGN